MNRVLGTEVSADTARRILALLGFPILPGGDDETITVSVPPFRAADVSREIDLIEEIIRIHGYDKIPERATLPITVGGVSKAERASAVARDVLVGIGYNEAMTNKAHNTADRTDFNNLTSRPLRIT